MGTKRIGDKDYKQVVNIDCSALRDGTPLSDARDVSVRCVLLSNYELTSLQSLG